MNRPATVEIHSLHIAYRITSHRTKIAGFRAQHAAHAKFERNIEKCILIFQYTIYYCLLRAFYTVRFESDFGFVCLTLSSSLYLFRQT